MQYMIIGTSRMTPSCRIEPLEKLSLASIKRLLSRQQQSIKSSEIQDSKPDPLLLSSWARILRKRIQERWFRAFQYHDLPVYLFCPQQLTSYDCEQERHNKNCRGNHENRTLIRRNPRGNYAKHNRGGQQHDGDHGYPQPFAPVLLANGNLDLCRFAENKADDKNRDQCQDIENQKQHQHGNLQPGIQVKDTPRFSRLCILVAVNASARHVGALAHHDQLLLAPDHVRVDKRFQFTFGWRIGIGFFHETVFIVDNTDYYSSIMLPVLINFNHNHYPFQSSRTSAGLYRRVAMK